MHLEIQSQHTQLHPRWKELIDRGVAKLQELHNELLRLNVTLVHNPHHLRGAEEVRLLLHVPGETLTAHKTAADMGDAIHAAFDALTVELRRFLERRRDSHRRPKEPF
jgi:ribosomal subunit interface protein